jgi:hypothetical protein
MTENIVDPVIVSEHQKHELLFRRGAPIFYAFDILYLNNRDLRRLPLIERKEKLRSVIEKSALPDVLCGKYIEARGVDLFNEVVRRNLEGVVAKRKTGTYATVSGWLKIKNPNYTQSEQRHELFDSFKVKPINGVKFPPIPKKAPLRAVPVARKTGKSRRQSKVSSVCSIPKLWSSLLAEVLVRDGMTQCVDLLVECPKCGQENVVRVATGHEIENLRKSISCVYCSNPWTEFLPGQLVSGPVQRGKPLS